MAGSCLATSVFQDVTAVPFLILTPVLGAATGIDKLAGELGWAMAKALLAFAFVLHGPGEHGAGVVATESHGGHLAGLMAAPNDDAPAGLLEDRPQRERVAARASES